jgi:hypothetical protein
LDIPFFLPVFIKEVFFAFGNDGFFMPPPDGAVKRDDAGKFGFEFFMFIFF